MAVVTNLDEFRRRKKAEAPRSDLGDYAAFKTLRGRCPGCHARRSHLVAFHDNDSGARPALFARTLPHYRCNGKRILRQDAPLSILGAELDEGSEEGSA